MRIVSLLPSTTEIAFALGLGDQVVAVTHECDYPPAARELPVITGSALDHAGASSEEIDAAVRGQLRDGLSIYSLDNELLAQLRPDLILTQALCEVCAVSFSIVERAVARAGGEPQILSLEPTTLDGVLGSIVAVGNATGCGTARGTGLVFTVGVTSRSRSSFFSSFFLPLLSAKRTENAIGPICAPGFLQPFAHQQ